MHTTHVRTITRKIRLHIMNKEWVLTYIICRGLQSNTHIYTHISLQTKLVLINLARGTQHVFPFTSCPDPRVAQWKPSILVCLQFVSLNFLPICIIQRWPAGLTQEAASEDSCDLFHSDVTRHAFSSFINKTCI